LPEDKQINYDAPQELTKEQIAASQGTRKSEKAPWETYNEEMDIKMPPELEAAVMDYAQNYHEESNNSQNKEELARQQELNAASAGEYQFVKPDEYNDVDQRMGHILSSAEFIRILRNKVKLVCFYRDHPQSDKLTLLVQRTPTAELEVACWVQRGWMPELSIMDFDDHGIPLAEKFRGWRTCCMQMVLKDMLNEEQINKHLGAPKQTDAYGRYNAFMQSCRTQLKRGRA
jgi:hypothetical protein